MHQDPSSPLVWPPSLWTAETSLLISVLAVFGLFISQRGWLCSHRVRRAPLGAHPAGAGSPVLLFAVGSRLAPVLLGCPWGGRAALQNAFPKRNSFSHWAANLCDHTSSTFTSCLALLTSAHLGLSVSQQKLYEHPSRARSALHHPSRWAEGQD